MLNKIVYYIMYFLYMIFTNKIVNMTVFVLMMLYDGLMVVFYSVDDILYHFAIYFVFSTYCLRNKKDIEDDLLELKKEIERKR